MTTDFFKGKRVTVFGIGLLGGGVGTIKFLVSHGAKVIATDIKDKVQLAPAMEQLKDVKNVEFALGQHRREDFTNVDMVIKTPMAPWTNKHVKLALEHNIPVEVDSSLFFKLCKNPIIGITGTKGKTTTSHLVHAILEAAGKHPVKVGIGQTSVLDRLALLKKDSTVVFELSSWRLSGLAQAKMSPHIAIFKNLFPDHMNYYRTMEEYFDDKKLIFKNQKPKDWFIANNDDERVRSCVSEAPGNVLTFGQEPQKNGRNIFIQDESIFLNDGVDTKKIMNIADIPLRGEHNVSNVMAAAGATFAFGVPPATIASAVKNFVGVPHRLEFVKEVNGVKFYNDTTATNPGAAIAAMDSFEEPTVLIAGGSDKELDHEEFAKHIVEKVKAVVFIKGKATDKIIAQIKKNLPEDERDRDFEIADSMEKAVEIAVRGTDPGDVVLLSPGAASFGVFRNEFERGNLFKKAVEAL